MICKLTHCGRSRREGDLLFCPLHRDLWRAYVKANALEEVILKDNDLKMLLAGFARKIYGQ